MRIISTAASHIVFAILAMIFARWLALAARHFLSLIICMLYEPISMRLAGHLFFHEQFLMR
jgi:hypothetical protein